MIRRTHRFHGHNSVQAVYKHGSLTRGSLFSLKTSQRGTKPWRAAVVVSRKVSKSAVVRNRIRRRIFETIRLAEARFRPGTDLVITVFSQDVAVMETAELQKQLLGLLDKALDQPKAIGGSQTAVSHGIVKPTNTQKV